MPQSIEISSPLRNARKLRHLHLNLKQLFSFLLQQKQNVTTKGVEWGGGSVS